MKPSTEPNQKTAIGLDVGTSRIVTARQSGKAITCESQLNAFVSLPYSKLTENALRMQQVLYIVDADAILVPGKKSEFFADILHREVRRPMTGGLLNPAEPESLKVIRNIFAGLLGDAAKDQKLCFTVPAAPLSGDADGAGHENTLHQILWEMGFDATSITEGLAVIYSELADTNYTGIGVSCGGGLCNVCFAYLSVPVFSFSIPKAGDFIDTGAASIVAEPANSVRLLKEEAFYLNGDFTSRLQQVLTSYYDKMIHALVHSIKEAFVANKSASKISRSFPLVLSGGCVLPQGFRERFEKILHESDCALPLSEVRLAAEPLNATAKGALFAALSES